MATLYGTQSSNVRKTWFLIMVFSLLVIGVGWAFNYYYGQPFFLLIAVVLSSVMSIISYWKSDTIVLSIAGAKPANKQDYYDLYTLTENLAITAGLPMPRLYIVEDSAPNAFATGRDPEHGVVAVTTGLLAMLNKAELEGVIAHELAHIKNRDTLLQTAVVILVGLISILADWFLHIGIMGGDRDNKASGPLAIIGIVLIVLSPLFATMIQLSISRKREFLADASGALLTRYPEGLAQALLKIEGSHQDTKRAHAATAHLYFSNPFKSEKKSHSFFTKLFMTHPPTEERVATLRGINI